MKMLRIGCLFCGFLSLVCSLSAQTYTVTDLGALSGFSSSHAYDNNNLGQATGCSDNSTFPTVPCSSFTIPADAFLWSSSGGMQDLGNLPGYDSSAGYVANDSSEVVGYSANTQTGVVHGFYGSYLANVAPGHHCSLISKSANWN